MSLIGLVEHLTAVERSWFQRVMQGAEAPAIWEAGYQGELSARRQLAGCGVPLCYVLIHMIEEYARHNGHADLLRERLDGSTGE